MNTKAALAWTAAALALAGCLRTEAEGSAHVFSSVPGAFSVRSPARFREDVKAITVGRGDRVTLHSFNGDAGEVVYVVTYVDYPAELASSFEPESMLDRVVKGQVSQTQGQLLRSDPVMLGQSHGRATELEVNLDGVAMTMRGRDYLVGDRLYQMFTVQRRDAADAPAAQAFLDSFETTEARPVNQMAR